MHIASIWGEFNFCLDREFLKMPHTSKKSHSTHQGFVEGDTNPLARGKLGLANEGHLAGLLGVADADAVANPELCPAGHRQTGLLPGGHAGMVTITF